MLTNLKHVLKAGCLNFWRNKLLSFSTLAVMTLALLMVAGLLLLGVLSQSLVAALQGKVDVSVYFKPETNEKDVLSIKDIVEDLSPVAGVAYVSREQALDNFKQANINKDVYLESLKVLGDNPLGSVLQVRARQPQDYASIVGYLEGANFKDLIGTIDYRQHEPAIQKLMSVSSGIRKTGLVASLFLAFVAIMISFNTIRLAIFNQKEEVTVMRLVGASAWSIRGPFLVEGLLYGFIGSVVTILVFWPSLAVVSPRLTAVLSGVNLLSWFEGNILGIWGILLAVGIVLGLASSMIAIRKYLKV